MTSIPASWAWAGRATSSEAAAPRLRTNLFIRSSQLCFFQAALAGGTARSRQGAAGRKKTLGGQPMPLEDRLNRIPVRRRDLAGWTANIGIRNDPLQHKHVLHTGAIIAQWRSPAEARKRPKPVPDFVGFCRLSLRGQALHGDEFRRCSGRESDERAA